MGVYHITYAPRLKEICLYFDGSCNFSCRGCIRRYHPQDCHLDEPSRQSKNRMLSKKGVLFYLKPLPFKRAIFLGWEPTVDSDFIPLARTVKEGFSTYNILLTNGYRYVEDRAVDEVCVSIKAISKRLFKDFTGRDNPEPVFKNFKRYTSNLGLKVRAESIFIPGYIDRDEIEKIARFIAGVDPTISYRIDGYIPSNIYLTEKTDNFRRPTENEMEEAKVIAEKYLKNVFILHSGIKVGYKVRRIY